MPLDDAPPPAVYAYADQDDELRRRRESLRLSLSVERADEARALAAALQPPDPQRMHAEREQPTARTMRDATRTRTVLTVSQRGDVAIDPTATRDDLARALLVLVRDRARLTHPIQTAYTVEVESTS